MKYRIVKICDEYVIQKELPKQFLWWHWIEWLSLSRSRGWLNNIRDYWVRKFKSKDDAKLIIESLIEEDIKTQKYEDALQNPEIVYQTPSLDFEEVREEFAEWLKYKNEEQKQFEKECLKAADNGSN